MKGILNKQFLRVYEFIKRNNALFIFVLILIAAIFIAGPKFTKFTNVLNLMQTIGTFGLLAAGLSLVFIVGGIDLSIGYQVAFCGTVFAIFSPMLGLAPAMLITVCAGLLIGYINGTIVTRLKIPSLIGTLAVMTVLKGFVLLLNTETGGKSMGDMTIFGNKLPEFYNLKIFGFINPSMIIALILFCTFAIFLKWSRNGANMYAVGGNPEAAFLSGIDNGKLTRIAYTLCGACSSICSMLLVLRNNASTYNMGDNIDIIAICAVVIGGIKMTGGKGNMGMCILGVAIIQTINNAMIKLGLHTSMQAMVTGIIVILVLILNKLTGKEDAA